jgi:hypothetical protein
LGPGAAAVSPPHLHTQFTVLATPNRPQAHELAPHTRQDGCSVTQRQSGITFPIGRATETKVSVLGRLPMRRAGPMKRPYGIHTSSHFVRPNAGFRKHHDRLRCVFFQPSLAARPFEQASSASRLDDEKPDDRNITVVSQPSRPNRQVDPNSPRPPHPRKPSRL